MAIKEKIQQLRERHQQNLSESFNRNNIKLKTAVQEIARLDAILEKLKISIFGNIITHLQGTKITHISLLKKLNLPKEIKSQTYIDFIERDIKSWTLQNFDYYIKAVQNYAQNIRKFYGEKIYEKFMENSAAKYFHRYYDEIKYLEKILQMIEIGERQKKWEEFEKFYHNIKSHIRHIKDYFGDSITANEMEQCKNQFHESPEDWKNEMKKLIQNMINNRSNSAFIHRILPIAQDSLLKTISEIKILLTKNSINEFAEFEKIEDKLNSLILLFSEKIELINKNADNITIRVQETMPVDERKYEYLVYISQLINSLKNKINLERNPGILEDSMREIFSASVALEKLQTIEDNAKKKELKEFATIVKLQEECLILYPKITQMQKLLIANLESLSKEKMPIAA